MPRIRIDQLPTSDAPDWVRKALVGVDVYTATGSRKGEILSGLVTEQNFCVQEYYAVVLSQLIAELRHEHKVAAANWFSELSLPPGNNIAFLVEECVFRE